MNDGEWDWHVFGDERLVVIGIQRLLQRLVLGSRYFLKALGENAKCKRIWP